MLFILQEKETQGTFYMKFPLRSYNSSEAKSRAKIIFQTFPLKKNVLFYVESKKREISAKSTRGGKGRWSLS